MGETALLSKHYPPSTYPWNCAFPKLVFKPSIFRWDLLVLGSVVGFPASYVGDWSGLWFFSPYPWQTMPTQLPTNPAGFPRKPSRWFSTRRIHGTCTLSYTFSIRIKQMVGKYIYISYIDPIWGVLSFKRILNLYSPKPRYRFFFRNHQAFRLCFKDLIRPPTRPPAFNNDQASTPEETDPSGEIFCFRRGPTMGFFTERNFRRYCWWFRNPAFTSWALGNSSHYLRCSFKHHRQGQEFWTINSVFYSKVFVANVLGGDALQFCWRVLLRFLSLLAQKS